MNFARPRPMSQGIRLRLVHRLLPACAGSHARLLWPRPRRSTMLEPRRQWREGAFSGERAADQHRPALARVNGARWTWARLMHNVSESAAPQVVYRQTAARRAKTIHCYSGRLAPNTNNLFNQAYSGRGRGAEPFASQIVNRGDFLERIGTNDISWYRQYRMVDLRLPQRHANAASRQTRSHTEALAYYRTYRYTRGVPSAQV